MKFNKVIVFLIVVVAIIAIIFGVNIFKDKKTENSSNNKRIVLKLNTEGLGQVSYYIDEDNKVDFDDEYPSQSVYTTFEKPAIVSIDAKGDDEWEFVKWTKDGKEYSKESKLNLTIYEDTELIAVFETK